MQYSKKRCSISLERVYPVPNLSQLEIELLPIRFMPYCHPLPTRRTAPSKRVANFPMQSPTQICNTFALCKQDKK